jgi:hypothetical protein
VGHSILRFLRSLVTCTLWVQTILGSWGLTKSKEIKDNHPKATSSKELSTKIQILMMRNRGWCVNKKLFDLRALSKPYAT